MGIVTKTKKILKKAAKAGARINPALGLGVFLGAATMGTVNRIKNRRKKKY